MPSPLTDLLNRFRLLFLPLRLATMGFAMLGFAMLGFAMLSSAPPATAQDAATGAIRGTVVDLHALRIWAASIALVNVSNGLRYSTTTGADGRFAFDLLPPGEYS